MYSDTTQVEFAGQRSETYKSALSQYPDVWKGDLEYMQHFLTPQSGETILEIGAGSGYFSFPIAEMLGSRGRLIVTDPSLEQLAPLQVDGYGNIDVFQQAADTIDLPIKDFDAIWSRGAIHHVRDKTSAFTRLRRHLKHGGRMVICDVFAGSTTARYFDDFVARSSCTGHEVAFLSHDFARSLCAVTGWETPQFADLTMQWKFESMEHLGHFLYLLFATTDTYSEDDCLHAAEELLGIRKTPTGYVLTWPMTMMTTRPLATDAS